MKMMPKRKRTEESVTPMDSASDEEGQQVM